MADHHAFEDLNIQLLAISANNPFSQQMYAASLGLSYPLLSDHPWTCSHETLLVKSSLHTAPPMMTRDGVQVGQSVPASVGARPLAPPGARR